MLKLRFIFVEPSSGSFTVQFFLNDGLVSQQLNHHFCEEAEVEMSCPVFRLFSVKLVTGYRRRTIDDTTDRFVLFSRSGSRLLRSNESTRIVRACYQQRFEFILW